jgi:hypothetical protein
MKLCVCHGEPMYWHKEKGRPAGGFWRCHVKHLEYNRRYRRANPEQHLEHGRRHRERLRRRELIQTTGLTKFCHGA